MCPADKAYGINNLGQKVPAHPEHVDEQFGVGGYGATMPALPEFAGPGGSAGKPTHAD